MTQLKWGIGGVLTLAVVAVGGNLYADKSLGGVSKSMLTLNEAIIDVKKG